jgi:hypothetical protein
MLSKEPNLHNQKNDTKKMMTKKKMKNKNGGKNQRFE